MMVIFYIIAVGLFALAYFLLLTKYAKSWTLIHDNKNEISSNFKVTVLIAFRNEEENLPLLLNALKELNTAQHDVEYLFVNDHSTDNSVSVIESFAGTEKYRIEHLLEGEGKKAAIRYGWAKANGSIIIQTDADCDLPRNWLLEMTKPFSKSSVHLVSGPVSFVKQKGFFHKLVALDFLGLIAIGAAHIQMKKPMICNGANLAYRKEIVLTADLYNAKASGDDVFLMQSIASSYQDSIVFCKSKDAIVLTKGPRSLKEFWNQRLRWASKNGNYSSRINLAILLGVWMYNVIILASILSFTPIGYTAGVFLIVIKWLAEETFYSKFELFFDQKSSFITLGLGQVFHIIYMAVLPIFSQLLSYQWKERKLK